MHLASLVGGGAQKFHLENHKTFHFYIPDCSIAAPLDAILELYKTFFLQKRGLSGGLNVFFLQMASLNRIKSISKTAE